MKGLAIIGMAVTSLMNATAWSIDYCDTEVRLVTPGTTSKDYSTPPSDAIVLFDGRDLSAWKGKNGSAAWEVHDGVVTVKKGTGDIETTRSFGDIQLHAEWQIPVGISGEGQRRGNSGIFIQGRYEVQIMDSYGNRTYANGQAGSIYGQAQPLVNAMRKPGEWNVFDIIYTAPRFNEDGTVFSPARVTVLQNGVLVQNNTEIYGDTGPLGKPGYYVAQSRGPIRLQDHPDPSKPISYRNIWVRELGVVRADQATAQAPADSFDLDIVSRMTLKDLLDNPTSREVLSRCLPELVPSVRLTNYMNKSTLPQLKSIIMTLSDEKLRMINAELARAQIR
jgi:hypothetical protein